jgi:hypothetical protein
VLDYWQSIRGGKDFPPIHDLDPLELSDAAPSSLLLELAGGGQDADIRHLGDSLKAFGESATIGEAPRPSLLACIGSKLGIVAISRSFLAFEDEFPSDQGMQRCWITLLPFSSTGAWVDFVYGFVTVAAASDSTEESTDLDAPETAVAAEEICADEAEAPAEAPAAVTEEQPVEAAEQPEQADAGDAGGAEAGPSGEPEAADPPAEAVAAASSVAVPGFSRLLAPLRGFHGTHAKVEPTLPPLPDEPEPIADTEAKEGTLQSRLDDVRAKADEARAARLRSEQALHDGLSAAYDFALDAEDSPEEYLRLVESQGLKIQLRAPMAPVVKLGFAGLADEATIADMETVLAWALKQELPRGGLGERIAQAGGIEPLLGEIRA